MLPHDAWATRQGIPYTRAVLLECEPDPDGRLPVYTSDQSWPADTIRYASGLGYEPSMNTAGVPAVGASILSNPEQLWHHLTLAFVSHQDPLVLEDWRACRQILLQDLGPAKWPAPRFCYTILHVVEAEHLLLLSRRHDEMTDWLARQIARSFDTFISLAEAGQIVSWVMAEGTGKGCRLRSVIRSGSELVIAGRWGRGRRTALQAGEPGGAKLEVRLPRSPQGAV